MNPGKCGRDVAGTKRLTAARLSLQVSEGGQHAAIFSKINSDPSIDPIFTIYSIARCLNGIVRTRASSWSSSTKPSGRRSGRAIRRKQRRRRTSTSPTSRPCCATRGEVGLRRPSPRTRSRSQNRQDCLRYPATTSRAELASLGQMPTIGATKGYCLSLICVMAGLGEAGAATLGRVHADRRGSRPVSSIAVNEPRRGLPTTSRAELAHIPGDDGLPIVGDTFKFLADPLGRCSGWRRATASSIAAASSAFAP